MFPQSTHPSLPRLIRLAAAIAGAFALVVLLLQAFIPARVALGEPEAVGLQIDKQGPTNISVDEVITYTIFVTNVSGTTLDGVVITDTWNTQLYDGTYTVTGDLQVNSFTFTMQTLPRYAQWNLQPLAPGDNGSIQFNMVVTPAFEPRHNFGPTTFGNSAVITTSTPGQSDAFDNVDTLIIGPVLRLTKTFTPTNPRPGRLLTYTFLLENLNRSDAMTATNAVITERLPSNTIFYAAYPPSIWTYDPGTNIVHWFLTETLPVSSVTRVTLTVRVTPTILSAQQVVNNKGNCGVYADAAPANIPCTTDVFVTTDQAFEKVTVATIPPLQSGPISKTFPNRIITYTVFVYNPFEEPVTGMLVTDTLPTFSNNPTQTFQYSDLLSASPPALPTVISQSTRLVAWELPTIDGWGLYTFTFRAYVPPQMRIADNASSTRYQNQVRGSYAGIAIANNDGAFDNSMKIDVVPQVWPFKSVTPAQQFYGLPVTYTLVISNGGPTTIRSIAITDVLPTSGPLPYCAFQYDAFVSGTPPRFASGNLVAWDPITLTAYAQTTLATFRATVVGGPNVDCFNTVEGYSPDTYIVRQTRDVLAKVRVIVPFGVTKTVNPSKVVLGGSIDYTARWTNVGGINATMNGFTDVLPSGFYAGGNPIYTDFSGMPLTLLANQGNQYQRTFSVNVITTSEACDTLPRLIYQIPGTVQAGIISPPELADIWSNSTNLAGVEVHPQARVFKNASPPGALPGEVITFTIVLSNNTSLAINNVRVTETLPSGFTYNSMVQGSAPILTGPPDVVWDNQSIPANGTSSLVFRVNASSVVGNYFNNVKAASTTDPVICIPKLSPLFVPVKRGQIEVNKLATPRSVNPLGRFEYNIVLKNIGPYTITIARFTDTLPGVPGHIWKYDGLSSGPAPASTNPPAWTSLTIGPDRTTNLRFFVRADAQVGSYPNTLTLAALSGYITASLPSGWVLTPAQTFTGTPVTVVPGVGMIKEVDRPAAFAGEPVVYTITLVNVSGNTINNVRITDTLPSGFTYEAMLVGSSPVSTAPLVWTFPSVASGEASKVVLAFRVRIAANQPTGTYFNQVSASANNIFIAPTGSIAPVDVSGIPTLNLSKSVTPAAVAAGREVTYTLTLFNPDLDGAVVNARISDTLPANFSYVAMVSGLAPSSTSPKVVWTGISVPAQTTQTLVFRALVSPGASDGTYYNQLDGSSSQIVFNSTGPAAPVVVVAVPSFDLQVFKSDGVPTNTLGGTAVYTIVYTSTLNALGLSAKGVVLTETFSPANYLTADAPDWNFVSPGVYTRLLGDLPAGASGSITFGLFIDPAIPQEYLGITNTVQVGAAGALEDPAAIEQPASNNTSTDIDVIRGADITVVGLTVAPASPRQGAPITVAVTFLNQGVDPTQGPQIDGSDPGGWFGADLYVRPDGDPPPSGPADRYLGYCGDATNYPCATRPGLYRIIKSAPGVGLAPGETYTVTYTYVLPNGGVQWLYVQADPFWNDGHPASGTAQNGRIREANEQNNIFGPVAIDVQGNLYLPLIRKNS